MNGFRSLKRPGTVAAIATFGLVLAACGSGSDSGGSDDTLKIGAVVPLSGTSQVYGNDYRKAIDICVDYANKEMDLKSKLDVTYTDGQGLPAPSVTAMNKLVNVDKSEAVITGFSAPTKALAPIANQRKIPIFNGGASSPDLEGLGDYVFNNIPLADAQIPAMTDYLVNKKKLTKWYVLLSNETLGISLRDSIKKELPKVGGEYLGASEIAPTASDFGAQIAKLRAAKPDVIYLAVSSGGQPPVLVRQMRQAGITAQLASFAGQDGTDMRAEPAANGSLFTSQAIDLDNGKPLTKYFVETFAKKYKDATPSILQSNYCGIVSTIAQAAKTLEESGDEVDGENIGKAIHDTGTFPVVGGDVTFTKGGTVKLPIDIILLKDGKTTVQDTFGADE